MMTELSLVLILIGETLMPIVEPAELLGHITTEDGRRDVKVFAPSLADMLGVTPK